MIKSNATKAITNYKDFYTKTASQIAEIRASKNYTDEYKAAAIQKVMDEYRSKCDSYKAKAIDAVNEIKSGFSDKRQAAIKKGLESAEQINLLLTGIANNAYSPDMLKDITASMADNPFALDTIRNALLASDNEELKAFAASIPKNNDNGIMRNLDRISDSLSEVPSPDVDSKNDWNVGFYQNGTTFDGWISYIDGSIEE